MRRLRRERDRSDRELPPAPSGVWFEVDGERVDVGLMFVGVEHGLYVWEAPLSVQARPDSQPKMHCDVLPGRTEVRVMVQVRR